MEKTVLDLPAMYGDHHVTEVRRILLLLPGVSSIYASSAFRQAEVSFDPALVSAEQISTALAQAGYLGDVPAFTEATTPSSQSLVAGSPRHTVVYEQTRQTVSFSQAIHYQGRPLWPCPGMGVIRGMDEKES
jgi:copper chaperone CopZ